MWNNNSPHAIIKNPNKVVIVKSILKLYDSDKTLDEIAAIFKVSRATICRIFKNNYPNKKRKTRQRQPNRKMRYRVAVHLLNKGCDIEFISYMFGVDKGNFLYRLRLNGYIKHNRLTIQDIKTMWRYRLSGLTCREVGVKFNTSTGNVSRILIQHYGEHAKRLKIYNSPLKFKMNGDKYAVMMKMYSKGLSSKDIAKEIGMSRSTVLRYIRDYRKACDED